METTLTVLDKVNSPADLRSLSIDEMNELSHEMRELIIKKVNTIGGHLINATISLTGEIFITPLNGTVERKFCEKTGLNLLSFQQN